MKKGQMKSLSGLKCGRCNQNNGGQCNAVVSDVLSAKITESPDSTDRHDVATASDFVYQENKDQDRSAASDDVYRAIRLKCLECSGDSKEEVRLCNRRTCPLFAYRLGRQRVVVERSRAGSGPHQGSLLEF